MNEQLSEEVGTLIRLEFEEAMTEEIRARERREMAQTIPAMPDEVGQ